MRIIILGAGQVGSSVTSLLVKEDTDITVIDSIEEKLRSLQTKCDINVITGHASQPSVLRAAGAANADMIVAVTSSDEVNLLACQMAHHLFNIPTRIARIRDADYFNQPELFCDDKIAVSTLINPEDLLTNYLHSCILYPGTIEVMEFAAGRLILAGIKAVEGSPLAHNKVSVLRQQMPNIDCRVAAIYRNKQAIMPEGTTSIEPDDEVFFLAEPKHIDSVMSKMRKLEKRNRRVIIAGGGHIGEKLALALQKRHKVKIIEHNHERCQQLTNSLSNTVVLRGSCVEQGLLNEADLSNCDIYCAITNNDENNIMSCLLAKDSGAKKTLALVNNPAYEAIFAGESGRELNIDRIIEPQQITVGSILSHVRRGDVVRVHSLRYGAAEALETIAHGTAATSRIIGKELKDIELPHGVGLGALVRGDKVMIAHHDLVVEPEDHLIFFVVDLKSIKEIEQLVGLN